MQDETSHTELVYLSTVKWAWKIYLFVPHEVYSIWLIQPNKTAVKVRKVKDVKWGLMAWANYMMVNSWHKHAPALVPTWTLYLNSLPYQLSHDHLHIILIKMMESHTFIIIHMAVRTIAHMHAQDNDTWYDCDFEQQQQLLDGTFMLAPLETQVGYPWDEQAMQHGEWLKASVELFTSTLHSGLMVCSSQYSRRWRSSYWLQKGMGRCLECSCMKVDATKGIQPLLHASVWVKDWHWLGDLNDPQSTILR